MTKPAACFVRTVKGKSKNKDGKPLTIIGYTFRLFYAIIYKKIVYTFGGTYNVYIGKRY